MGDGIRNISNDGKYIVGRFFSSVSIFDITSPMYASNAITQAPSGDGGTANNYNYLLFDAGRKVPTSNENTVRTLSELIWRRVA